MLLLIHVCFFLSLSLSLSIIIDLQDALKQQLGEKMSEAAAAAAATTWEGKKPLTLSLRQIFMLLENIIAFPYGDPNASKEASLRFYDSEFLVCKLAYLPTHQLDRIRKCIEQGQLESALEIVETMKRKAEKDGQMDTQVAFLSRLRREDLEKLQREDTFQTWKEEEAAQLSLELVKVRKQMEKCGAGNVLRLHYLSEMKSELEELIGKLRKNADSSAFLGIRPNPLPSN